MEYALVGVLAVVCITAVNSLAPRLGVAAPLVLVLLGIGISFLPFVPTIEVEPEWVLGGILPPLLYSAAVSLPAMEFRRDFGAIGGLSVALVVLSSVVLGVFFTLVVPGLGLAVGIALGAIISPTDPVATTIVKRLGVSPRVVTVLEGESLLNDATALVLLRSAILATTATVTLVGVTGQFVFSVVAAVAIGVPVGLANLRIRARVDDPTISTTISFVVPFIAYLPAEHLGASGLVAAVAAGLVTGQGSAHHLRPQDRISEALNWRTVELLLEGAIFLLVGLQLDGLVREVREENDSLTAALGLGVAGLAGVLLVRGLFFVPLLYALDRRRARAQERKEHLVEAHDELERDPGRRDTDTEEEATSIRRKVADVEYLAEAQMGWREGAVLTWAGMRGVVTVAAAQSLPAETPHRAELVLVAYVVAAVSLLVQGATLRRLVRALGLERAAPGPDEEREAASEQEELRRELAEAAAKTLDDTAVTGDYDDRVVERMRSELAERRPNTSADSSEAAAQYRALRVTVIRAQRDALLRVRHEGSYSSEVLGTALTILDADEMRLELREEL